MPNGDDTSCKYDGEATTARRNAASKAPPPSDHAFYEFTFRRFFNSDGHGCPTLVSHPKHARSSLDTLREAKTYSLDAEKSNEHRYFF